MGLVLASYVLLLILGATQTAQLNQAQKKAAQIDAEMKQDKELISTLEQYNGLVSVSDHLNDLLATRFLFMPSWNVVKNLVPKEIQFSSMALQDDRTYRITADSKSIAGVANFAKALESNDNFSNIVPSAVNHNTQDNTYSFGLTFRVSNTLANGVSQ